jgi:hypothetical protein
MDGRKSSSISKTNGICLKEPLPVESEEMPGGQPLRFAKLKAVELLREEKTEAESSEPELPRRPGDDRP